MELPKWPYFNDNMINAVTDVLRSGNVNYWTGDKTKQFEYEFANYVGTKYAIALSNGTAALEACLHCLSLDKDAEVIVPGKTFIASASAIIHQKFKPVFCDVDINTQNITLETIKQVYNNNVKAIICVHLGGYPCDMDPILQFAKENNIWIIEDCAQAHGAKYKGISVGSLGHIGAWSFCQDKIITTGGEGGMITTNNLDLYKKIWSYKDHGKNYDIMHSAVQPKGFRWLVTDFGTNLRMTEMQAVIGIEMLKELDNYVNIRRRNSDILREKLKNIDNILILNIPNQIYHSYYRFYIFLQQSTKGIGDVINDLLELNIPASMGSCSEIYKEQCFIDSDLQPKSILINCEKLSKTSICILVHPTITEEQMHNIANKLCVYFN